jgi:nucleoside-diphosphate-sugar epimerase
MGRIAQDRHGPQGCKVAMAEDGGTIPVWGDGTAVRAYTYACGERSRTIDDLVEGITLLMQSDREGPTIVGGDAYVTVDELVETVIDASGKEIGIEHVEGPVGVHARNFKQRPVA